MEKKRIKKQPVQRERTRVLRTRFWSDNFIVGLEPLERYLFLYLITNEHCNISGVYELPIRYMSFESGISMEDLQKMLLKLESKITYIDGWVCVRNFMKHQALDSINTQKGISAQLNRVPEHIIQKLQGLGYPIQGASKGYQCAVIYLDSDSDSDLDSDSELTHVLRAPEFLEFWEKYPKKKQQNEAATEWLRLFHSLSTTESKELQAAIISDVHHRLKSQQWTEQNGRYIPQAAKYLAEKQWENPVPDDQDATLTEAEWSRYRYG